MFSGKQQAAIDIDASMDFGWVFKPKTAISIEYMFTAAFVIPVSDE